MSISQKITLLLSQIITYILVVFVGLFYVLRAIFRNKVYDYTQSKNLLKKKITRHANIITPKERDELLSNGFSEKKIPENLDAIVIGSGMGGLGIASLLSQTGKKVLVLERHDRAGGSLQTFEREGFEFDVGLHYVGELESELGMVFDEITEGEVDWMRLPDPYDTVAIYESPDVIKKYPIRSNENRINDLYELFPNEKAGIDEFLKINQKLGQAKKIVLLYRLLPKWLIKLIMKNELHLQTGFFDLAAQSLLSVITRITKDKDLQTVLGYNYGAYGTFPSEASIVMSYALFEHYFKGAYYPVGGTAQIPATITKLLQSRGSQVLVRADVSRIVLDSNNKTAIGIEIMKAGKQIIIKAPLIISDVGAYNTYHSLLSDTAFSNTIPESLCDGVAFGTIFIGYNKSCEELGINTNQSWYFSTNDILKIESWFKLKQEVALEDRIPVLFTSFPSTKDFTWKTRFPGKTVCEIVLPLPFSWFEIFKDKNIVRHRGEDYEALKTQIYQKAYQQFLEIYPQFKDVTVDYYELGTPLTNTSFLHAFRGVIYGLGHSTRRFSDATTGLLECQTPLKNLYLTGQDTFSGGVGGAAYGAFLCASEIYHEPLVLDLLTTKLLNPK